MKSRFASKQSSEQGLRATTIEEVLVLPDYEIDIATAILLLSKQWDNTEKPLCPSASLRVDVEEYRKQIDEMAKSLEPIVAKARTPQNIIKAINDYIFEELKFDVPKSAIAASMQCTAEENEKLFLLHWVLDRKRGNCVGLSVLYLSLAERLHLPIYGVVVPEHWFVRYDDNETKINIETTDKGKSYSDAYYTKDLKVPTETRNLYLVNLSKKQIIGCFLNNIGTTYYERGKLDEAITSYQTAIRINPNDGCAYCKLGMAYRSKGEFSLAIAGYKKAIEMKPECADAHVNLGTAYANQGKTNEAIASYQTAISINPDDAKAHVNLGAVYQAQGKLEAAIASYQTAISINPNDAKAHDNLGVAYANQGNLPEAIASYQTAISINPNDAIAHVNLGVAYVNQGKTEAAIASYQTGISINPNDAVAHVNLGAVYQAQGKLEAAIASYQTAISINPNDANAHYNLACCYSKLSSQFRKKPWVECEAYRNPRSHDFVLAEERFFQRKV
ncbi:tetratricopeptide repeat protein [bacterium]|nr:tetratricopeptide repeat protein [bacterium]